jgi:toxin HigB-1
MGARRYYLEVIHSYKDGQTEGLFQGRRANRLPPDIQRSARRKLLLIDAATNLDSLRVPPGNRLEALKGDRKGQHSIRINDQWRICFVWRDGNAFDVEITDYHS